ncbi:hypothetical protein LX73_1209 [Fodinibius salinus]|uniref:Uncharacterized protein n=1 Tax=Fodinibius salinus TaxID=860790 RepID=A0A5D3YIW4_9BACT|nr:hypothetical protein LX73_1209 [Fodinibius salinus]
MLTFYLIMFVLPVSVILLAVFLSYRIKRADDG